MNANELDSLDAATLMSRVGADCFARGRAFVSGGHVRALNRGELALTATVRDGVDRTVRVSAADGSTDIECDCGEVQAGSFCAHAVAAMLAWIDAHGAPATASASAVRPSRWDELRENLETLDRQTLLELLSAHVMSDDRLMRRLETAVARTRAGEPDVGRLEQVIDAAARVPASSAAQAAMEYAKGLDECADEIERTLDDGHAAAALNLVDHAIAAVERALGNIADDDGDAIAVLHRLEDLHFRACLAARPDVRQLARRLVEAELGSNVDLFVHSLRKYRKLLGSEGLEECRRIVKPMWDALPRLGSGDRPSFDSKADRLREVMLELAEISGEPNAWLEIETRDLSSPGCFAAIVERFARAGQFDGAIDWAQRGLSAFADRPDTNLRRLLAGLLHRTLRHGEATAVVWSCFVDEPSVATYEALRASASMHESWPEWQARARDHFRAVLAEPLPALQLGGSARWDRAVQNEWVRVQMAEGDFESAWIDGLRYQCSTGLMLELARGREKEHPEEVVPVYKRYVAEMIDSRDTRSYPAAVSAIMHMKSLARRCGQLDAFAEYVSSVRRQHRAKSALMTRLDRAKLD